MDYSKKQFEVYLPWLLGVSSFMSFVAILDLPYGYFRLLRLVIFLTGILYLYVNSNPKLPGINVSIILVILLWNPIFPVYLTKEIWTGLNLIVGIGGLFLIFRK
jgi:hypothetical protein